MRISEFVTLPIGHLFNTGLSLVPRWGVEFAHFRALYDVDVEHGFVRVREYDGVFVGDDGMLHCK